MNVRPPSVRHSGSCQLFLSLCALSAMALAARADIPSPHPDPVVTNPPNLQFHLTFYDRQALPPHTVFSRAYSLRGPAEPGRLLPGMRVVTDSSAQIYYGSDGPGYRQATLIDAQTGLAND